MRLIHRGTLADLMVIAAIAVAVIVFALFIRIDSALFITLYYGLPAAYLCYRRKKNYRKVVFAAVVLGLLLGMAFDFAAEFHDVWTVHYGMSLFSLHVIGKTPVGDFLWAFLIPFYTIIFYEHFVDGERLTTLSKNARNAFLAGIVIFLTSGLLLFFNPDFPRIPYAYASLGFLTVIPLVGIFHLKRNTIHKILFTSAFFFVFNFFGEVEWLVTGQGSYTGQYLAWLPLVVTRMPIEEFLYWTILSTPAFIFCYEWLFDDFR